MKYLYEIYLDDELVGDSGEEEFDEKYQAQLDAESYINFLADEYSRSNKDFEIVLYEVKNLGVYNPKGGI